MVDTLVELWEYLTVARTAVRKAEKTVDWLVFLRVDKKVATKAGLMVDLRGNK